MAIVDCSNDCLGIISPTLARVIRGLGAAPPPPRVGSASRCCRLVKRGRREAETTARMRYRSQTRTCC